MEAIHLLIFVVAPLSLWLAFLTSRLFSLLLRLETIESGFRTLRDDVRFQEKTIITLTREIDLLRQQLPDLTTAQLRETLLVTETSPQILPSVKFDSEGKFQEVSQ